MRLISVTIFRPRKNVKNYILRYDNDNIRIYSLFLCDSNEDNEKILCEKFGKKLILRESLYSRQTIQALYDVLNHKFDNIENGYWVGRLKSFDNKQ